MIDILLSAYNGEKYLSEQLDSLFSQSYDDFKIIVRDDGSSDKTKDILIDYKNNFGNKLEIYFENNVGPKNSFFDLIKKSSNDYVMFCDQDDVWLDNILEVMMDTIKQYDDIPTLAYCDLKVVDENLNVICDSFDDLLNYIKYLKDSKKDYQLYEFYINYKDKLSKEDTKKIAKILKKGHLL